MGLYWEEAGHDWAQDGHEGIGQAVGAVGSMVEDWVDAIAATGRWIVDPIAKYESIESTVNDGIAIAENTTDGQATAADYAAGVVMAFTPVADGMSAITGYDARQGRLISTEERAADGLTAFGNTILSVIGGAEGLAKVGTSQPQLYRPKLRTGTRAQIDANARRTPDGRCVDPNTLKPIDGKHHYGHVYGKGHRRLVRQAQRRGLSQKEFNDWVNDHPEWFQVEDHASNASHRYEKPGCD